MAQSTEISEFRIEVPQSELDDLRERLSRTRFAQELPGVGSDYGVPASRIKELTGHWLNNYDWRAWEAKLNSYPQFTTQIDGQKFHFLHVKSSKDGATPLLMIHGWPGSVVEFLDLIAELSEPKDGPAFDLVIPSLPGFAWSGPTTEAGWGTVRTANAFLELMDRLGYPSFGIHGNDAGSMIAPQIARIAPERVIGAHMNQIFSFPSGDPAEMAGMSEQDMKGMQVLQWFWEEKGAFNILHSQQPQTIAHALADSPVGLLGWHDQLMGEEVSADFAITNAMTYWLTDTSASAIRFYYEDKKNAAASEPTTVPVANSCFATDFQSIRRFADRDHKNIVQWRHHDMGGHYAAHEVPHLVITDLRDFFAGLSA